MIKLRQERLKNLGHSVYEGYADLEFVNKELENSRNIFQKNKWSVVDITGKAVEETAAEIISFLR